MKNRILSFALALCLLFVLCACSATETAGESMRENEEASTLSSVGALADNGEYYGTVFGQGDIIDISVEMNEDDWQSLKDNAEDEEYYPANITVNGTTVENVGFRAKGFSSLKSVADSDSDRYGFKVKLDEYVDEQTLNGLDMFVLNGSFSDPSYMREYLTYAASAYLGCDTPYLSYCNLYVNGELFGFYICVEAYNDSFVERYTDADDTVLYKAVSEDCTLLSSDDGKGFDVQYGKDDDYSNITNLITVLNSTTSENKTELEAILDVDSVLKAIATNTVMGNYDSYSGSKAHNYYLLYSDGKFTYLGWDYNMSIGGFMEDNGASVSVDVSSPVYGTDISQRPLIEKLLAIGGYNERYLGYVNALTEHFSGFENTVSGIAGTIREYVTNDPSAFYTDEQFETNIVASDADLTQVESKTMNGGGNDQMQMPDGYSQNMQHPNGSYPPSQYGTDQFPQYGNADGKPHNMGGMGGSINSDAVSIVDYITQRISNIKSQLSD